MEDIAGVINNRAEELAFVDGQRQRLFDIDIFACAEGVGGHFYVPMIRDSDEYNVQIGTCKHVDIVFVDAGSAAKCGAGLFAYMLVNITKGYDVSIALGFLGNDRALVSQSDRADS